MKKNEIVITAIIDINWIIRRLIHKVEEILTIMIYFYCSNLIEYVNHIE